MSLPYQPEKIYALEPDLTIYYLFYSELLGISINLEFDYRHHLNCSSMKKIAVFPFLFICLWFLAAACSKEDSKPITLKIICEDFRPYNYWENGQLKGISVEIADTILGLIGQGNTAITLTADWDSAMNALLQADDVMLFSTDMTPERKNNMKWVGPLYVSATGFTGLNSSALEINSLEEAKTIPSVGVVTGYSTAETLENLGFGNLVYFSTITEAISALYNGTVSAVFDMVLPLRAIAAAGGWDVNHLTEVFHFSIVQGYFAFSAGVPSSTVSAWQDNLDNLKKQGFLQALYNRYLPGTIAPGKCTLYTEKNPPQNYLLDNGTLTGSSVEMVKSMMQVIHINDPVTVTSWSVAYDLVQWIPNSMLFSTLRNDNRENKFKWVGPVCKKNYCFFVQAASPLVLNAVEDAKTLGVVGVPEGWASVNELEALGFSNLQTWPTPEAVFEKLIDGTADAVVLNDISIDYLAAETGHDPGLVRNELVLSYGETYLAFNPETNNEYIEQWQQAYNTIKSNGTLVDIWNGWYSGISWGK